MMTEQFTNTQALAERDVLSVPRPTTDEVIILGEDTYETPAEAQANATEADTPTAENQAYLSTVQELDSWLVMKVKNELVAQVFKGGIEDGAVNISNVASMLQKEIMLEKDKHFQAAIYLENDVIPHAGLRLQANLVSSAPYTYWKNDITNLWNRVEVHQQMVSYVEKLEQTGNDWAYDLSENYIIRTRNEAREEALSILLQQKEELELRKKADDDRIAKLEGAIEQLAGELNLANDKITQRDMQILDNEMTRHLQKEGIELAA